MENIDSVCWNRHSAEKSKFPLYDPENNHNSTFSQQFYRIHDYTYSLGNTILSTWLFSISANT